MLKKIVATYKARAGETISPPSAGNSHPFFKQIQKIIYLTVFVLILLLLYFIYTENFLLFHGIAETFSIVVAFGIFMIAWNLRNKISNNYILFVGYAFVFIAFLDILHTLSYKGMNIFPDHNAANLATQLWISARYMECITLLIAPFLTTRRIIHSAVILIYLIFTIAIILFIFIWEFFPVCYIDSKGLTNFKIVSEYVISGIFLLSIFTLVYKKKFFDKKVLQFLITAIIFKIISELAFTEYVSVYDFMIFIGHVFKIISFYFIYLSLISIALKNPFDLIFRELQGKTKDFIHELEFINAVINIADVLILVINTEGKIVLFNKTCEKLTGYTFEEIKNIPYWEIFVKQNELEGVIDIFEDLKSGKSPDKHENYWKMKDGSLRLISWSKTILLDEKKDVSFIVAIGLDITDKRNLDIENKNIISMIAHDMKSPLLSVQLFVNRLIKKWVNLDDVKKTEYLEIIRNEGIKLNDLIDEFLEFSLMQHGLISINPEPFSPQSLLTGIYDIYNARARENNIKMVINCSFDREITGDISRLNRVFTNLLDNAIKFSNANDTVYIDAHQEDHSLKIEIVDTGIGIEDGDLPNIFHPYMRGRNIKKEKGFGLGLSYVKAVIEKHNGKVFVQSTLGKGTKVTILLPLDYTR